MEKEPYVWIKSRRVRNPHYSQSLAGTQRVYGHLHGPNGSRLGNRTRLVRTATSDDLFQTGQQPAFIDHYGHLIPGITLNSDKCEPGPRVLSAQSYAGVTTTNDGRKNSCSQVEREEYFRGPGVKNQSFYSPDATKVQSNSISEELNGIQLPGRPLAAPESEATSAQNFSTGRQHILERVDLAWERTTSARERTTSARERTTSAWEKTTSAWERQTSGRILRRPTTSLSLSSVSITLSSRNNNRPKTSMSRSSRSVTSDEQTQTSHGDYPKIECDSRQSIEVRQSWSPGPRPFTSVYNTVRAKSYLEERLKAIFLRRRVTSAGARKFSMRLSTGDIPRSPSLDGCLAPGGVVARTPLARFRMLGYLAVRLRRMMLAIISNSSSKTQRSATELQWMAVYSENNDDSLAFNKYLYSRDRVIAHVPDWALSILNMRPEERTEQHCRRLHALLRGLRSFDKFTEEMQMSLCRAFTLEKVEEGRVVLKSGHIGVHFYFIYSGSVFVNSQDQTADGQQFMRTVAILSRGDSFGELALLQDIRRTATISVREKCELLVVDKDVFASVCPKIFEKELSEKHAFISTLDLFSSSFWSTEAIHALCMNAQIQEYKANKVIVADSSVEDWIYACMEGKCQVIRCVSLDAPVKDKSKRRQSDVVLSEEILQLLAAAEEQQHHDKTVDDGDMKENLLSSLGLDYVQTGKKLYMDNTHARERKRAILGLNDTTTLTSLIQRKRETEKNIVFLDVGVIESGGIFDLPSLLEDLDESDTTSTLMLVSGGAKILRVKKVAFFDQATQQAIDNTRTLSSKQRNPTEETILSSYKCQLAWDQFKAQVVRNIVKIADPFLPISYPKNKMDKERNNENRNKSETAPTSDNCDSESNITAKDDVIATEAEAVDSGTVSEIKAMYRRRKSNYYEEIEPVNQKEEIIIRRKPSSVRKHLIVPKPRDTPIRFSSALTRQR